MTPALPVDGFAHANALAPVELLPTALAITAWSVRAGVFDVVEGTLETSSGSVRTRGGCHIRISHSTDLFFVFC